MPSDLTVSAKVITTPLNVVLAPKVTASPKVCAPVVRTLPALSSVLPPALVVKMLSFSPSVLPPSAPLKVLVPLSLIVRLRLVPSEFNVLPKVIATPLRAVSEPKVTAPE